MQVGHMRDCIFNLFCNLTRPNIYRTSVESIFTTNFTLRLTIEQYGVATIEKCYYHALLFDDEGVI